MTESEDDSSHVIRRRLVVSGRVQGVWFRDTCRREAIRLGVNGWVRNDAVGTVTAVFEGESDDVEELVEWARVGPPKASVDDVEIVGEVAQGVDDFRILD